MIETEMEKQKEKMDQEVAYAEEQMEKMKEHIAEHMEEMEQAMEKDSAAAKEKFAGMIAEAIKLVEDGKDPLGAFKGGGMFGTKPAMPAKAKTPSGKKRSISLKRKPGGFCC